MDFTAYLCQSPLRRNEPIRMKRIFLIFILMHQMATGRAVQQIQNDREAGRISAGQALFYEALLVHAPERLPSRYQESIEPVKCGFGVSSRLQHGWHLLSDEQASVLKPYLIRPSYPFSMVSPSGLFRLHYTHQGLDSVSVEDVDANGVSDFVEEAAQAFDYACQVIVTQMGFHQPPMDDADGPEWDVYLEDINSYGYTESLLYEPYIVIDNDFSEVYTTGLEGLRVTCAHEFFHLVQLGYQYRDSDVFLMEASAVWMEDVTYDHINDYLQYLDDFLSQENVSMTRKNYLHEYGLCLWFHFLSERYGRDIVRQIWEQMVHYPNFQACSMALAAYGMDLNDEIAEFYGWNLMTGDRADTLRFYPEGHLYPEQTINEQFQLFESQSFRRSVTKTGVRYFETTMNDQTTIVWALVNADWSSSKSQGDGLLQIQWNEVDPYLNKITDSVYSMLISDQGSGWRYSAMVQQPDETISLQVFPEFSELQYGKISGTVWIYKESGEDLMKSGGLSGITMSCLAAGEDSLFDTEDDNQYSDKETDFSGGYEFFALPDGKYRITLNESGVSQPYVTVDGVFSREFIIENANDITDADFGFWSLQEASLPASVPNPYVMNEWPDMKIPFTLEAPDLVTFTVFSSQGFKMYRDELYFDSPGMLYFRWNGYVNDNPVPSGVYLYVILCNNKVIRKEKIAIVR